MSELEQCLVWTKLCQKVEPLEPTLYALLVIATDPVPKTAAGASCGEFEAWFGCVSSLKACLIFAIMI